MLRENVPVSVEIVTRSRLLERREKPFVRARRGVQLVKFMGAVFEGGGKALLVLRPAGSAEFFQLPKSASELLIIRRSPVCGKVEQLFSRLVGSARFLQQLEQL